MKGMKAFLLYLGYFESASNYTVFDDTFASVANPHAQHRMMKTCCYTVLIQHPEAGWMMFDTGIPDHCNQLWEPHLLSSIVVHQTAETSMRNQLALVGLKPEDIKHVIVSHLHVDHAGNNPLFAQTADFYVAKEEAAHAFRTVMASPDPASHGFYRKDEVLTPVKQMHYVDRDEELFPDVEVILLPGHTPAVLGLVLHLEGGTYIFPSDAVNVQRNYEGHLPGGLYDSLGYVESLRKIRALEKKYSAKVMFSHDMECLKTYKLAPDYYE